MSQYKCSELSKSAKCHSKKEELQRGKEVKIHGCRVKNQYPRKFWKEKFRLTIASWVGKCVRTEENTKCGTNNRIKA